MATALQASPFLTKNSFYNSQPPPLAHAPHFAGAWTGNGRRIHPFELSGGAPQWPRPHRHPLRTPPPPPPPPAKHLPPRDSDLHASSPKPASRPTTRSSGSAAPPPSMT